MQKDLLKSKEEYQEAFDGAVEGMKIAIEKNNYFAELYSRKQDKYQETIKASEEQVKQRRQNFTKIRKEKVVSPSTAHIRSPSRAQS